VKPQAASLKPQEASSLKPQQALTQQATSKPQAKRKGTDEIDLVRALVLLLVSRLEAVLRLAA